MFVRGMAAMKRFLTLCLALAFLLGATVQLVPCGMAGADLPISAENMAGCAGAEAPCHNPMPNCIDYLGCVALSALPAAPVSIAVTFAWAPLVYDLAPASLSGISVEPELSPPIRTA